MSLTKVLDSIGFYTAKKAVKDYFFKQQLMREDAARKKQVEQIVYGWSEPIIGTTGRSDVVVSLTSYGERAVHAMPYAVYSLMCQTVLPDRIVVWLDDTNWSDDKLSVLHKKLQALGVEFRYTEDIRSYKKLLPTLKLYPDSVIITVDDDMYYHPQLVEKLMEAYKASDGKTVLGPRGVKEAEKDGEFDIYAHWPEGKENDTDVCMVGCEGILYPPHIFDAEVFNQEVFMRIAPTTDDIWFWAMERLSGAKTKVCHRGIRNAVVDRINMYFPMEQKDNLFYTNGAGGQNEKQLRAIIAHYQLKP